MGFVALAGAFGMLFAAAAFMRNHCAVTDLQTRTRELRNEYAKRQEPGDDGEARAVEAAPASHRQAA